MEFNRFLIQKLRHFLNEKSALLRSNTLNRTTVDSSVKLQKIIFSNESLAKLFCWKITLLKKSKKVSKRFLFKIWFFSSIIKALKKVFFPKKKFYFLFFVPWIFLKYLKRGSSHWFLNKNQKNLVVPHIVPRGTSNPWLFM